jgi:hypothetical protein
MYYSCISTLNCAFYRNTIYVKNVNLPAHGISRSNKSLCRTITEQSLNIHSKTPPCRTIIEQCLNIHSNIPSCRTIIEQCLNIHIIVQCLNIHSNTSTCRNITEHSLNIQSHIFLQNHY